ncbi:hypothetical protein BKA80DRAFT_281077 [Phyllosticta citrichinensis]
MDPSTMEFRHSIPVPWLCVSWVFVFIPLLHICTSDTGLQLRGIPASISNRPSIRPSLCPFYQPKSGVFSGSTITHKSTPSPFQLQAL